MDVCVFYLAKRLGDLYFSKSITTAKTNCTYYMLPHTHQHTITPCIYLDVYINFNIGAKYVTGFVVLLLLCVRFMYAVFHAIQKLIDYLQML